MLKRVRQTFFNRERRWLCGLSVGTYLWIISGAVVVIFLSRYMGFISRFFPG